MSDSRRLAGRDQAEGLRRLFGASSVRRVALVSALAKPQQAAELAARTALGLADAGHAVTLIDEYAAPNALSVFGVTPQADLFQVLMGDCAARQAVFHPSPLIRLVAASRAARVLEYGEHELRERINALLGELQRDASYLLINCHLREHRALSPLAMEARDVVVVLAPQAETITRAYALIKRIAADCGQELFHIAVSRARNLAEARNVYDNLARVANAHLGVQLNFLGQAGDHLADALVGGLTESAAPPMEHFTSPTRRRAALRESVV
ncbi:MAG TPA: hypothetical protein VI279_06885 [Rhodocyclaceae bacterium]